MKMEEKTAALEAVLFAAGEPADTARIAEALGITELELDGIAAELERFYAESGSALQVLKLGSTLQLSTLESQWGFL